MSIILFYGLLPLITTDLSLHVFFCFFVFLLRANGDGVRGEWENKSKGCHIHRMIPEPTELHASPPISFNVSRGATRLRGVNSEFLSFALCRYVFISL